MSRPQKSTVRPVLIRIAFAAKNFAAILQQNPEFLLPVIVVVGIGIIRLVGAL